MQKKNNSDLAHALSFRSCCDRAPRVLARGEGGAAKRMVELANLNHVPVVSNEDFNQALSLLPLQTEIPENLYRAAATLFASISALDQKHR